MNPNLKDKIYIVIPAYNEEKSIGRVLEKIKKQGYKNIIVIDDGSTDKTSFLAKKSGAEVIKHPINRGQGAALATGIEYCLKYTNAEYIVTFDADGQHRIEDLEKFMNYLIENKADIAIGTRFKTKTKINFLKKLVLKGGIIYTFLVSGLWLSDTHNGYRVLTRKAAKKIKIIMDDFTHASEILDEISRKKIKYVEVPTKIIYSKYAIKKGQKIRNAIKIALEMLIRDFL